MLRDCMLLLAVTAVPATLIQAQAPGETDIRRQLAELHQRNEALAARVAALEMAGPVSEEPGSGLTARYGEVTATFQVFGDAGFSYTNTEDLAEANSSFFLGSVDFFANVQMGDRFRILSESVLDARGGETIGVDQERLWAMWTVDDGLYLKLGTEHSPISRWNQLYHHGHWLETSISRPLLASFEGDGGILPMHATGLELGGRRHAAIADVEWFAAVSNGRGREPTNKQRTTDRNDSKRLDAGLAILPAAIPDLRVGQAFTFDEIPADTTSLVAGRGASIRELLATTSGQYRCGPLELLGEFAWIEHDARALGATFHHHAGYVQAAWHVEQLTPYVRIDYRQMERGDPFYVARDRDLDAFLQVAGVRYDATENMATKLEIVVGREEDRASGGGVRDWDIISLDLQVSWVF